jgi:hypothetical protein
MSSLPRVTEAAREQVTREFDEIGPETCMAVISADLERNNPELLDMALRWARDVGNPTRVMMGFGMFYRLLSGKICADAGPALSALPRVTPQTRDVIVSEIDAKGTEAFTTEAVEALERDNPELLQMAHNFAAAHSDYLGVMQGFAVIYRAMAVQAAQDKAVLH